MTVNDGGAARRYLGIGEIIVSDEDLLITTVLGSCVSIVLRHEQSGLSAICHAQLPERADGLECRATCPDPCGRAFDGMSEYRYVSCAAARLIAAFDERGLARGSIRVGLYGGGDIVSTPTYRIGERNIDKARSIIAGWGLRISDEDTGGKTSRRLSLDMRSGRCAVQRGLARA